MKLGILALVTGIALLIISIPLSIIGIISGVNRLTQSDTSGGFMAYLPMIGVIAGFLLTTIGATRVFKN